MEVAGRPIPGVAARDMTAKRASLRCRPAGEASPEVAEGFAPEVLADILRPNVMMAIWHRRPPSAFTEWIARLDGALLPDGRFLARCSDLRDALAELLDRSGTPAHPMRQHLSRDICMLANAFAGIMASDRVDLRLEAVRGDACWKFHRDRISARFLTTYRGPGTEWVAGQHADRALTEQRAYRGPLHRLPPHGVALFKGDPHAGRIGVVHRSPPIAATGTVRLLLCLNPPSPASPALWEANQ